MKRVKREPTHLGAVYDTDGAAAKLRVAAQTLKNWRVMGKGPRFFYVGGCVRYTESDLAAFAAANTHQPTRRKLA
jgi:helix-turn-helix protein